MQNFKHIEVVVIKKMITISIKKNDNYIPPL